MMVRHAIVTEDKQARRKVILHAASVLFTAGDGSLPAMARVAAAAGLAKGTVYLYFRTKEEIFAALLIEGLGDLLGRIGTTFGGGTGRRAGKVATFLDVYVDHIEQHPELLRLDALGYGVLDKNIEPTKLRAFKLAFVAKLVDTATIVEHALRLSPGRGASLLMRTFALTRGLWQSSNPGEAAALEADVVPAILHPNFSQELREALAEYWRGALVPP